MKIFVVSLMAFLSVAVLSRGQGIFVYDQQSADESVGAEGGVLIQESQPVGQSFTPTLSSVGFIRLKLGDSVVNNLGATVYVNLRSDSITGPILGASVPVFMRDGFIGFTNFLFSTPISVTPGATYYFQPVVQSGDSWGVSSDAGYHYSGGTAFFKGVASQFNVDLWFREGIIVPEPSTWTLLLLFGGSLLAWFRRRRLPGN